MQGLKRQQRSPQKQYKSRGKRNVALKYWKKEKKPTLLELNIREEWLSKTENKQNLRDLPVKC